MDHSHHHQAAATNMDMDMCTMNVGSPVRLVEKRNGRLMREGMKDEDTGLLIPLPPIP